MLTDQQLHDELQAAEQEFLDIADRGTLIGLREDKKLICISFDLYNRLIADSQALAALSGLAQTATQSWPDSIEDFHNDGGAVQ